MIRFLRSLLERLPWRVFARQLAHEGATARSPRLRDTKRPALDEFAKPKDIIMLAAVEIHDAECADRDAFDALYEEFLTWMEAASRRVLISEVTGLPLEHAAWDRSEMPARVEPTRDAEITAYYTELAAAVDEAMAEVDLEQAKRATREMALAVPTGEYQIVAMVGAS